MALLSRISINNNLLTDAQKWGRLKEIGNEKGHLNVHPP
jgi:hypothetical protein